MNVEFDRIVAFLQREYLFQGLTPPQVAQIATRFTRVYYQPNEVIFLEGDPADCFYIVMDGRVRVTRTSQGRERLLNLLGPGDFFGEQALLFDQPRTAAAFAETPSLLLRLDAEAFDRLLQDFPGLRLNLSATAESRNLARRVRLDWLGKDEVVYFLTRKHDIFLILGLIFPILLGVGSLPVMAYALVDVSFMGTAALVLATVMLGGSVLWGAWAWVDWGNDYFIVTNQRVVWLEKVIGLYDSRREAPLDAVLAVDVVSSQIGRILDYGDVRVRTYTGGIVMHNVHHPKIFSQFVEGYKRRALMMTKDEEAEAMKKALDQALERRSPAPSSRTILNAPSGAAGSPSRTNPPEGVRDWWQTFLKVRYERNGVITYRKHWFLLMQKAWKPVIVFALLGFSWLYLFWLHLVENMPLNEQLTFYLILLLLGLLNLLWLGYYFWDWSNDIYRLTPEQILDIERKPLGQEVKKTANLESIISIEHERENLWGILFNFGPVIINVGQTRFIFLGVYNPDQVHQDISDYRDALNRKKRVSEATRERDRMVKWLVTFHEEQEKFEEKKENQEWDEI